MPSFSWSIHQRYKFWILLFSNGSKGNSEKSLHSLWMENFRLVPQSECVRQQTVQNPRGYKTFLHKWMENKHGRNGPTGESVDKRKKYFRNSKHCENQNLGQRGLRFQDGGSFIVSQEKVQGGCKISAGLIFLVCYWVWIHCFFWQCVTLAWVIFFCCILLVFFWEIEEK